MPSNTEMESRWINAWSELYELAGDADSFCCRLPDGSIIDLEEGKQWLQDKAYQGLLIRVSASWYQGMRCAALDAIMDRAELYGFEFNWLGLDQQQQPAVFASTGQGPIPEAVLRHVPAHDSVLSTIPITRAGTPQIWKNYSRVGLYAYEWDSSLAHYVRQASPTAPPGAILQQSILNIPQLPRFALPFGQAQALSIDEKKDAGQ